MTARSPSQSRVEMTQIVMPTHTNGASGVLFGGTLMQWIDVCCAVAAMRHCGGSAVTASIDRLDFLVPIHVGDVVVLQAQVNYVARTSMEVGCRVETEDPRTGERRYTTKAYLTFVATDEAGRPRNVPPLMPLTREEKRRYRDSERRREERLLAAGRAVRQEEREHPGSIERAIGKRKAVDKMARPAAEKERPAKRKPAKRATAKKRRGSWQSPKTR